MKTQIFLCSAAALVVFLLTGIFYFEWDARQQRLAEQKDKAAAQQAEQKDKGAARQLEQMQLAVQDRIAVLHSIFDDFDRQYKLLHNPDLWSSSNKMAEVWGEYYSSREEARKQLSASHLDLSVPVPSTKYIDDEIAAGLLTRMR